MASSHSDGAHRGDGFYYFAAPRLFALPHGAGTFDAYCQLHSIPSGARNPNGPTAGPGRTPVAGSSPPLPWRLAQRRYLFVLLDTWIGETLMRFPDIAAKITELLAPTPES